MKQIPFRSGYWLIEQTDVGVSHVVHENGQLVEVTLTPDHVGLAYVVSNKGDYIGEAPVVKQDVPTE